MNPRSIRIATIVAAIIALVAGVATAGRHPSVPPRPEHVEGFANAAGSAVTPHDKSLTVPKAIGALAYENDYGTWTLATIDAFGEAHVCAVNTRPLQVDEVVDGTVIYTDGDLWERSLGCGPAYTIVTLKQLTGRTANDNELIADAHLSPNGTMLGAAVTRCIDHAPPDTCSSPTELWAGGRDGNGWHKVTQTSAGAWKWMDDHHIAIVGNSRDPYALDVKTGRRVELLDPPLWGGLRSPDGSRAIYRVADPQSNANLSDPPASVVLDRRTGKEQRVPGSIEWTSAPWAPDGSRFVGFERNKDYAPVAVVVYAANGKLVNKIPTPKDFTFEADGRTVDAGWVDTDTLWVGWPQRLELIDLGPGTPAIPVELPGPKSGEDSVFWTPDLRTASGRESSHIQEPAYYALSQSPRVSVLGISFRLPLSWRVFDCDRCLTGPYVPERVVNTRYVRNGNIGGTGYDLTIRTTTDPVDTAVHNIIHYWRADEDQSKRDEVERVSYSLSNRTMARTRFRVVDIGFWEDGLTYWVGRVNGRTYVLQPSSDEDDPMIRLMMGSLRFER